MFARAKSSVQGGRTYEYLQIVESYRDKGRVRQRIVATIGRLDELIESGKLEGLITSVAKFLQRSLRMICFCSLKLSGSLI